MISGGWAVGWIDLTEKCSKAAAAHTGHKTRCCTMNSRRGSQMPFT